jgi:hypothetical protein
MNGDLYRMALMSVRDHVSTYTGARVFLRDLKEVGREPGPLWSGGGVFRRSATEDSTSSLNLDFFFK